MEPTPEFSPKLYDSLLQLAIATLKKVKGVYLCEFDFVNQAILNCTEKPGNLFKEVVSLIYKEREWLTTNSIGNNNTCLDEGIWSKVCSRCKEELPIGVFRLTTRGPARQRKHRYICRKCENRVRELRRQYLRKLKPKIAKPKKDLTQITEKVCTRCKLLLPVNWEDPTQSAFGICRSKKQTYIRPKCNKCCNEIAIEKYWEKRDQLLADEAYKKRKQSASLKYQSNPDNVEKARKRSAAWYQNNKKKK